MIALWGPGATEYRFYWHQELESFSNLEQATAFVGAQNDAPFVQSDLTELLSSQANANLSVDGAPGLLMDGKLLTGDGPGLRLDPVWRHWADFRDRGFGLQFLGRFRHDSIALARLRGLLQRHKLGADVSPYTPEEVLAEISALLSAGRLVAAERMRARPGIYDEDKKSAPAKAASAPAAPAPSAGAEPEDETPTLPDNDAAAQAAALKAAAQAAFPFCEECQKAFLAAQSRN